jgi:CRISPR/Cas system CMR-associated protein Cmr1 (group 7 of RAMP superfamily)
MEKVIFEIETTTPTFLAGNDQFESEVTQKEENDKEKTFTAWHIKAEIRAASLRGLMRYWERALVGGFVSTLKEVQKYEQALFGMPYRLLCRAKLPKIRLIGSASLRHLLPGAGGVWSKLSEGMLDT